MRKHLSYLLLALGLHLSTQAQPTNILAGRNLNNTTTHTHTTGKNTSTQTDPTQLQAGLFYVQQVDNDWYLEIPETLLGKPILVTARYISTPGNTGKYGGELFNDQTVYWELGKNGKLFLRCDLILSVADSLDNINRAVTTANENPIIAAFKPESHKNGRYRIKANSLFLEDNPAFSPTKSTKQSWGMSSLLSDLSYIESIRTFPTNTEVRMTKTWYSASGNSMAAYYAGKVTLQMNLSFVLLPEDPMPCRLFDPRVGYFTDSYYVFSDYQQKVQKNRFITRWRLEPKDSADLERWKAGELIEPKKPIVYYIDPATPKKWRKYLIQGVNDWQKAFEHAGFKNAIIGREWPENDSTMSMEDARYSCIRYLASPIENAYGPQVHDPRTGEIIESHICWYHNVMSLLHDWYFIQASTLDEAARQMHYDDELMGELIRFVSSHEVGHTLGLRHNFGASSTVPVDSLCDKAWVEAHGHTPSIMDYARFNYVAQPEDSISRAGIFPRIGDYDCWAIKWGYTLTPNAYDAESDHWEMERLTAATLKDNPRLWFGDGETNRTKDPRCQTEDLGDDAVKAGEYGILNLKREIKNLPQWTYQSNDIYGSNLSGMYAQILSQFQRYAFHVAGNIGGMMADYKTVDQAGPVYTPTSKEHQAYCLDYLDRHLFHLPQWLIAEDYMLRITPTPMNYPLRVGKAIVANIAGTNTLDNLNPLWTADDFLPELTHRLFDAPAQSDQDADYRRQLQVTYVNTLINDYKSSAATARCRPAVLAELRTLQRTLAGKSGASTAQRNHYAHLVDVISNALDKK